MAGEDLVASDLDQKSPSENGDSVDISDTFKQLAETKTNLIVKVSSLKQDLMDFRGKIEDEAKSYQKELEALQDSLNNEVEQLKSEFENLRNSLRLQLEEFSNLGSLVQVADIPKIEDMAVKDLSNQQ